MFWTPYFFTSAFISPVDRSSGGRPERSISAASCGTTASMCSVIRENWSISIASKTAKRSDRPASIFLIDSMSRA